MNLLPKRPGHRLLLACSLGLAAAIAVSKQVRYEAKHKLMVGFSELKNGGTGLWHHHNVARDNPPPWLVEAHKEKIARDKRDTEDKKLAWQQMQPISYPQMIAVEKHCHADFDPNAKNPNWIYLAGRDAKILPATAKQIEHNCDHDRVLLGKASPDEIRTAESSALSDVNSKLNPDNVRKVAPAIITPIDGGGQCKPGEDEVPITTLGIPGTARFVCKAKGQDMPFDSGTSDPPEEQYTTTPDAKLPLTKPGSPPPSTPNL